MNQARRAEIVKDVDGLPGLFERIVGQADVQRLALADMPAWLQATPAELRNPYSLRPMRWDAATGSLNASLAQWLSATGQAQLPYRVRQGTALGRAGRMRLYTDDQGQLWVQGQVHGVLGGLVTL